MSAGQRLGILGSGQLGRMLGMAAHRLDIVPHVFAPEPGPAMAVTNHATVAAYDDEEALEQFAAQVDVVTYEVEALPAAAAHFLARFVPVRPSAGALQCFSDRLLEKRQLASLGIPLAAFASVEVDGGAAPSVLVGAEHESATALGFPLILKSRFGGYDGRGQSRVHDEQQLATAIGDARDVPMVAERIVPWKRELSVIAARRPGGDRCYYDVVQNHHEGGILRWSIAPAPGIGEVERKQLLGYVDQILDGLDYVGVLGVEFFETADGFLVNEVAPRVHNSGHWTMEGAVTSQFENHVRACLDLPLGSTQLIAPTAMLNLIGAFDRSKLLALPSCQVHLYGKEPRPGRKVGHVNWRSTDMQTLQQEVERLYAIFGEPQSPPT